MSKPFAAPSKASDEGQNTCVVIYRTDCLPEALAGHIYHLRKFLAVCLHRQVFCQSSLTDARSATMKRLTILGLLGLLMLSTSSFCQTLTDAQVIAAINRALSGRRHQIGLTLNDVQTNLLSGLVCTTCKTTGYTIHVFTPESWIELQAFQARREMVPFSVASVSPEMRLPYIHVLATPSKPEYLNANGMAMASSVHRVVLTSTDRNDVVQPLSESHGGVELNSAFRSFAQASAGAVFSLEDVEHLRSEDPKGEFFVVVVGDNQNKYFKVKTRFFNQLFGLDSDSAYAALKSFSPEDAARKRRAPEATYKNTAAETRTPAAKATTFVASTKPSPDIRTKTPTPVSTKPDAFAETGKSIASPNNATGRVAGERYDAYRYDSALIAEWWNLPGPDVRGSFQSADHPKSLANGRPLSTAEKGSIGVWCDEKPMIRHDGVRIDRIAPDGPADQAGLRIGDDILALDGIYLFTVEELMNETHLYKPGAKLSVRYRRRSTIYESVIITGAEETQKTAIDATE